MLRFRARLSYFLVVVACAEVSGTEIKQTRDSETQFIGAIGCKSSSCHGGAGEKHDQYLTWLRYDFHTHAFAILLDSRSARIAETVGISEAQSSARCTVCHSPFQSVRQTRLASTARADEGVSCESCHGAAGAWLRGHTRSDWTYAMRVTAGMRDLRSLYVRANTCVACHQNIDADLLKAGHPTLAFELDSQSVNEPKHWRDFDPWTGARAWLTGQAVALREAAWHARADADPSPDAQETSAALAWLLAKVALARPALPKIVDSITSGLEQLQKQADDLARSAAIWNPNADSTMSMLHALAETDSEFRVTRQLTFEQLFYRAKRLVLALDRLTAALSVNRAAPLNVDNELNLLREDARLPENFDAARFSEHLHAFRGKL